MKKIVKMAAIIFISMLLAGGGVLGFLILKKELFYTIQLPNGYILSQHFGGDSFVYDRRGNQVLDDPVTQFCVSYPYVLGWISNSNTSDSNLYFVLNTETAKLNTFRNGVVLDQFLKDHGIHPLSMKNSYTILDIKSGYKSENW